jgi:hypothetical protein
MLQFAAAFVTNRYLTIEKIEVHFAALWRWRGGG